MGTRTVHDSKNERVKGSERGCATPAARSRTISPGCFVFPLRDLPCDNAPALRPFLARPAASSNRRLRSSEVTGRVTLPLT